MQYVETVKEGDETIIKLYGNVTTYVFYNFFMKELYSYIHTDIHNKRPPIISIENVEWIDSNVLPCLISVGIILRKYYKVPSKIKMIYNPSLLQYLEITEFFYIVGEKELDIYTYERELVGGFNLYVKEYNRQYKIEKVQFIPGYYELNEDEKRLIKYELLDRLERFDVKRIFGQVLSQAMSVDSREYDRCIQAIAEIVCNAMLYSESDAYVCIQAIAKNVHLAISDIGIGFSKSLSRKNVKIEKVIGIKQSKLNKKILNSDVMDDFFAIFTALKYAEVTGRVNLWKLKQIVTRNNGVMRIHSNRVQVVFSYNRCGRCKHDSVSECMSCLMNNFSTDYQVSPLRIYEARIEGVHLEIDFVRGNKKC